MSTMGKLYCWIYGSDANSIFWVDIAANNTIVDLQEAIKRNLVTMDEVGPTVANRLLPPDCCKTLDHCSGIFEPQIAANESTAILKHLIKEKRQPKVSLPINNSLMENLDKVNFAEKPSITTMELLLAFGTVTQGYLHLIVKPQTEISESKSHYGGLKTMLEKGPHGAETRKISIYNFLENLHLKIEEFLTHPGLSVWTPPEAVNTDTCQFYHDLAIPKINDRPSFLLHNLSSRANPNVDTLFQNGADHCILCNTSGAGKMALLFDGLCCHWGFYFVATQEVNKIGTKDLELAIKVMSESSGWT
ncbi:hypothetical protein EDB83DRAFT_2323521 [Lactarius deliciosus]|nr:hypothetical protein EDB83DRAFT_2323521 [Lactarius deliciosus]